jgi:hypothetical protein
MTDPRSWGGGERQARELVFGLAAQQDAVTDAGHLAHPEDLDEAPPARLGIAGQQLDMAEVGDVAEDRRDAGRGGGESGTRICGNGYTLT